MTQPNKWIMKRIDELDPYTDYVEIWRLSSSYGHNEFMSNLAYALTFQNFIVTEWGSEVIWRDDGGKVLERPFGRLDQTTAANYIWWFYGPHDERTRKSVDAINRLHAHWAKAYPGRFSYNDDYVYVAAYTAIAGHRMRLSMGLPGITEKEKIAAHIFWGEMAKLFVAENNTPLHGYPESFDALIAFCEAYEQTPRPKPERTNLIVAAFHEQFVMRFFPKELHWLGHQLLRALSLPSTLATAQIDPPEAEASALLPRLLGYILSHQAQEDDPDISFLESYQNMTPEEKVERRQEMRKLDHAFGPHFIEAYGHDPKFAGCPFHAMMASKPDVLSKPSVSDLKSIEEAAAPHI